MEIDVNTGELRTDAGLRIKASTTLDEFLSSSTGARATKMIENGDYRTYKASSITPAGDFHLLLVFRNESIYSVRVSRATPGEHASWDAWSEPNEQIRKNTHDVWLKKQLGEPPYTFDWGSVFSEYDPRSGLSSVVIKYNPPKT